MGQKSSKKSDLFVSENVTHCNLSEKELKEYAGRAREYTSIEVNLADIEPVKEGNDKRKRDSSQISSPHSITSVLSKAHKRGYQLSFVVPKLPGSKPSKLRRISFIEEESKSSENKDHASNAKTETSHTLYLFRPLMQSRKNKEVSLKKMEATPTILNMMMGVVDKRYEFSVKYFSDEKSLIESGKYAEKLQELISSEAAKGAKLLSVMVTAEDSKVEPANGHATVNDNEGEAKEEKQDTPKQVSNQFSLRMVFLHNHEDDVKQSFRYTVACHKTTCKEEALKTKKNQQPKSDRGTNITWSENWLNLFKDNSRLVEVLHVGEVAPPSQDIDSKPKKPKPREFQVTTLCFYEELLPADGEIESAKKVTYDGLAREVWAPINDNIKENLENEAEIFGKYGWELCSVLVTSHVRMKQNDRSEHQKCIVFFQRPKKDCLPPSEISNSKEKLVEDDKPEDDAPASPKVKLQKFGVAIVDVQGGKTRLKSASKSPTSPNMPKKDAVAATALPAVQLKKVNREELKKEEVPKESNVVQQVKLRPTEAKTSETEVKESDKDVPWLATLERKRKAVMESEDKSQQKKEDKPQEDEVDKGPVNVSELKKKVEMQAAANMPISPEKKVNVKVDKEKETLKKLPEEKEKEEKSKEPSVTDDNAKEPSLANKDVETPTENEDSLNDNSITNKSIVAEENPVEKENNQIQVSEPSVEKKNVEDPGLDAIIPDKTFENNHNEEVQVLSSNESPQTAIADVSEEATHDNSSPPEQTSMEDVLSSTPAPEISLIAEVDAQKETKDNNNDNQTEVETQEVVQDSSLVIDESNEVNEEKNESVPPADEAADKNEGEIPEELSPENPEDKAADKDEDEIPEELSPKNPEDKSLAKPPEEVSPENPIAEMLKAPEVTEELIAINTDEVSASQDDPVPVSVTEVSSETPANEENTEQHNQTSAVEEEISHQRENLTKNIIPQISVDEPSDHENEADEKPEEANEENVTEEPAIVDDIAPNVEDDKGFDELNSNVTSGQQDVEAESTEDNSITQGVDSNSQAKESENEFSEKVVSAESEQNITAQNDEPQDSPSDPIDLNEEVKE